MNLSNQINEALSGNHDERDVSVPDWVLVSWANEAELLEVQPANLAKWESDLESENAELREKLAAAEKVRDHWKANHDEQVRKKKLLRERPDLPIERLEAYQAIESENAELRERLAAAEREREEVVARLESQRDAAKGDCSRNFRLYNEEMKETAAVRAKLARYKSTPGQWAVTCEGMTKMRAEHLARYANSSKPIHKAVPLAPEDGPWLLMIYEPGNRIPTYWSGHHDYYTGLTEDAAKLDTHGEALAASKEYTRKYDTKAWPVRLSDVKSD